MTTDGLTQMEVLQPPDSTEDLLSVFSLEPAILEKNMGRVFKSILGYAPGRRLYPGGEDSVTGKRDRKET